MGGLGIPELLIIFLVVLLVFGAKRIPEIAQGLGKGIREFKDATSDIKREIEREGNRQQVNQPKPPRQGTPTPRQEGASTSGTAQQEPAHQEAGRPASTDAGPPEPSHADNPGEEAATK